VTARRRAPSAEDEPAPPFSVASTRRGGPRRLGATQQTISRHLTLLPGCGVALRRQAGRQVFYRLAGDDTITLLDDIGAQVVNHFARAA